jgi:hypothetical protein
MLNNGIVSKENKVYFENSPSVKLLFREARSATIFKISIVSICWAWRWVTISR